jgi:hypothetical protein
MTRGRNISIWVSAAVLVGIGVLIWWLTRPQVPVIKPVSITGVVLIQNTDAKKQLPVPNARITLAGGGGIVETKSDASGLFRTTLRPGVQAGESITIKVMHAAYETYEVTQAPQDQLYVIRLSPVAREPAPRPDRPILPLKDVRLRYTVKSTTTRNLSSAAQPFEIVNKGNVPCDHHGPCSPDGRWKAAIGSVSLDAGEGNEFRNARLSCIAGPCPFTRVESENNTNPGRNLRASVRNWSDTVTFLVEAEVTRTMISDMVRISYPIKFGDAMEFTLPANAEGPCIEAELNGTDIVFPLGPAMHLSWADCVVDVSPDRTKLFQCQLKPGYRFVE